MITAATYQKSEQIGTTTYRVAVRLTDDVTGTSDEWFTVSGSTVTELANDLSRQIAARNALLTTKSALAGIAPGTAVSVTAPAVAAQTATQVWLGKAFRLQRAKALGLTNATAVSEINALQADVDATYVAGYVASV